MSSSQRLSVPSAKAVSCTGTVLVARRSSWPRKTSSRDVITAIRRALGHVASARRNIFQRSILTMFTRMIQIRGLNVPTVGASTSIIAKSVEQSMCHMAKDGYGRHASIVARCATGGEVEF